MDEEFKASGGRGFMIASPPLGCRREVSPLIDREWLYSPSSSKRGSKSDWTSNDIKIDRKKLLTAHFARPDPTRLTWSARPEPFCSMVERKIVP